jgi:segregation and condensation protein A
MTWERGGSSAKSSFLKRNAQVQIDCQVQLPMFEGPLDLLLHLIKSNELDILNLPVAKITAQYLSYLDYMREMNLDIASEYLVMAATLTYLKSQVILPQDPLEEAAGRDPRQQLIRRLIALKSYKELALDLSRRPRLFRDIFLAKNTGAEEIHDAIDPEVALSNPFQLSEALLAALERGKIHVHKVVADEVPIASCVSKIVEVMKYQERINFNDLLPKVSRPQDVISMFLGTLEMARMQITGIDQPEIFGPIEIFRKVEANEVDRANLLIKGLSWQ